MSALNPSFAFQARCSIDHVPPDPPFFVTNRGFKSVTVDESILPQGAYILELDDINLDMNVNMIVGQYHSQSETDLGVLFFGHLGVVNGPLDRGKFSLVRFQVLPGNITLYGPFMVGIINCQ